jgi:hypothetical protein
MPNHWIMGAVTGVFVDAKQHVWVTHLPETLTEEELYEEPWNVVAPPAAGAAAGVRPRRLREKSRCRSARAARPRRRYWNSISRASSFRGGARAPTTT